MPENEVTLLLTAWACIAGLLTFIALIALARLIPSGFLVAARNENMNRAGKPRQLGGLAIMPVCLACYYAFAFISGANLAGLFPFSISMVLLFAIGFLDDIYGLTVSSRLAVQLVAAFLLFLGMPDPADVFPFIGESWMLVPVVIVAVAYWVNVVNFMDGLDLVTVAGLGIPLMTLGCILAFYSSTMPSAAAIAFFSSACLIGFARFNWPPSSVILGDAGSYFLGAVSAFVVISVAANLSFVTAILPFLYYAADATSTLLIRLLGGQNLFRAHTTHAYQIAYRKHGSELPVVCRISALNVFLSVLALASTNANLHVQIALVMVACVATGILIFVFRKLPATPNRGG